VEADTLRHRPARRAAEVAATIAKGHDDHEEDKVDVPNMTTSRLQRFKDAQDQHFAGYEIALSEIRAGGKRSHWIWYVFPQLAGLGHSAMAQEYGIDGVAEAEEFLRDPVLRSRLLTIASAAEEHLNRPGASLERLMASPIDAAKLVSSMTLFGAVAKRLHAAEALDEYALMAGVAERLLAAAAKEGYAPCQFTLRLLHDR
jgi:uncharacterized protein (DUF1810 family)